MDIIVFYRFHPQLKRPEVCMWVGEGLGRGRGGVGREEE